MSEEIIKILDNLGEKFGMTVDWTSENIIPYLEELCQRATNWLIGEATVALVCATIAFILFLMLFICMWKSWQDDEEAIIGAVVIGGCTMIPCLVIMIVNILQIVKCCTCPELALLPLIKGLI